MTATKLSISIHKSMQTTQQKLHAPNNSSSYLGYKFSKQLLHFNFCSHPPFNLFILYFGERNSAFCWCHWCETKRKDIIVAAFQCRVSHSGMIPLRYSILRNTVYFTRMGFYRYVWSKSFTNLKDHVPRRAISWQMLGFIVLRH